MKRASAAHEKAYPHAGVSAKGLIIPALLGAAAGVLSVLFSGAPWLEWALIGLAALLVITVAVCVGVAVKRGKAERNAEPDEGIKQEPYEIRDPLFKKIMAGYKADGLSDFINYVSLRGWKLGYVEAEEDSIEFIFLRRERQVMVSLFDGYAETAAELQSEHPIKLKLDYGGFSEPVELWNAIINEVKSAARSAASGR